MTIRGIRLDKEVLGERPLRASAQDVEERLLFLQTPDMKGEDVHSVQQALKKAGFDIDVDGILGPQTAEAVKTFQERNDLTADGIVGPATLSALGL